MPPESIYLSELQVGSDARGRGVGGELLDWVEREAEVDGQKKRASGTRPPPSYGR